jgi:hypothetical protein
MELSVSTKIKVGIGVVEGTGSMLIPNTDLRGFDDNYLI